MDQISNVALLKTIPKGNRRHAIDIIARVLRISIGEKFKFFTCSVRDENGLLKNFSVKCFTPNLNIVQDVRRGAIVMFQRLWKKSDRRSSTTWKLGDLDLDLEFIIWGNSTVMIMANPEDGPISDFNMIVGALDNIQIIGIIEQLPEQDGDIFIMVIRDPLGNFAEITLHDGLDVIIGETWVFHGNVKIQDGVIMVEANHAHLEA